VGLQRGVGIELALGVVVFGVAAVLSGTPPSLTG
jgi:putative copper export protein